MADDTDATQQHRETIFDRTLSSVDRRSFLLSVAGSGYALGLASALGIKDVLGQSNGRVSVVTALVRSDPSDPGSLETRTTSVPAGWYAAVSKAFELHERIADATLPGYLGSSVEPGSLRDGTATISINVSSEDAGRIPGTLWELLTSIDVDWQGQLDNVAVSVDGVGGVGALEAETRRHGEPRTVERLDVDPVPGGVRCETEDSTATLAPAMYHLDDERPRFATAEHAFVGDDAQDGASLYLVDEQGDLAKLGRVSEAHPVEDVAIVSPNGRFRPGSLISGGTADRIGGQYTRWGLAVLAARNESLEKVGSVSGRTTGELVGIDAITCVADNYCRRGQLKWGEESDMTDGDSGSVSYHPDPDGVDGALVASLNNARTWWPGQNYVWGTAAYQVTERTGYHF